jgi:chromosome segregation ATPase
MNNKKELEKRIEEIESHIEDIKSEINSFELDVDDYEDQYIDSLNYDGTISVAGIEFDPSHILKELDPVAYNCGLNDFVNECADEDDEKYQELVDELESLEDELEELQDDLESLEEDEEE